MKEMYLFEALELRSEYTARVESIKACISGDAGKLGRSLWREEKSKRHPSPGFDLGRERETLRTLEFKQRKLNSAIQKANFEARLEHQGQELTVLEGLEVRKAMNARIAELQAQAVEAAYQTVIYKEGRDIVEANPEAYSDIRGQLDAARLEFRDLNRKLRRATFETVVAYEDE
jgi:hypothetical protein